MKITLKGNYKSLNDFESEDLNPFTVITGKNGSGKSQLIELFKNISESKSAPDYNFEIDNKIHPNKIIIESIPNQNLQPQDNKKWSDKIKFNFKNDNYYNKVLIELYSLLIENDIWLEDIYNGRIFEKTDLPEVFIKELIINIIVNNHQIYVMGTNDKSRKEIILSQPGNRDNAINILQTNFRPKENDHKIFKISKIVSKYQNKDIRELENTDYFKTPLEEYFIDEPDLFQTQIESLFYNYSKRRDINNTNFLNKIAYGDNNNSISDNEFIEQNRQPWIQINEIFEKHKLDFEFKGIERKNFTSDTSLYYHLNKKSINKSISLEYLSSGEKIIIGLIIKLFIAKYYDEKLEAPELILLDEPDAYLHPEMSKLLIDVLYESFVKDFGIKVIMTTHSPSTIALCPEDSIYQLKNGPITSLEKINKDNALELLTEFIPTLSIDYKNHKQIFVESETDVEYYQMIFNKVNEEKTFLYNLYFISNNNGKGNCDLVKKTVKQIRKSGNKTTFGIIDWDLKNKSIDFIKVHGEDKVYSIENYIYNPIYLVIYFMQEKGANNIYKELEIEETVNHYNIGNNTNESLQKICDWFFDKIHTQFKAINEEEKELIEFHFYNDKIINLPKWYIETKGHDLEGKLKKTFKSLDNSIKKEGDLQNDLIKVIAKCYPFIPNDSVDLIESLTS